MCFLEDGFEMSVVAVLLFVDILRKALPFFEREWWLRRVVLIFETCECDFIFQTC